MGVTHGGLGQTNSTYHPSERPLFSWRRVLPASTTHKNGLTQGAEGLQNWRKSQLTGLLSASLREGMPARRPMSLRNFLFPPAWWRGLSACFQRQPLSVPRPNTQPQESPAPSFPCHGSLPTLCPPRMLPFLVTARSNSA